MHYLSWGPLKRYALSSQLDFYIKILQFKCNGIVKTFDQVWWTDPLINIMYTPAWCWIQWGEVRYIPEVVAWCISPWSRFQIPWCLRPIQWISGVDPLDEHIMDPGPSIPPLPQLIHVRVYVRLVHHQLVVVPCVQGPQGAVFGTYYRTQPKYASINHDVIIMRYIPTINNSWTLPLIKKM